MAEETRTPRTKVKAAELDSPFLVERIGKEWNGGQYGPSFPLDITLADGTLAVLWVNSNSVMGRQLGDKEVVPNTAYRVENLTSKAGREYRVFREAE